MKIPEKNTERFPHTVIRTAVTTTIITLILTFAHVFPYHGTGKLAVFGVTWLMIFCIVFGGHWLEKLFINSIKLALPPNLVLLCIVRIIYWFVCAIPLFFLADWVGNSLTNNGMHMGNWINFGFFYIGIELFMHLIMQLRWKKSFYNGVY